MEDLNAVLNEQPEQPEQSAQVEQPEQDLQPEQTGEIAAPPAENEAEKQAKGIQAAMLAERQKRQLAEQRAAQLEAQLQRFTQQPEKQEQEPEATRKPDPANYQDNPAQYWEDLADWKASQTVARELQRYRSQAEEQQRLQREREAEQEVADRINEVILKGQAKYQDYDEAINAGLAPFLTPMLRHAIAAIDAGEDVSYWLAKNPAEAARISRLGQFHMGRELAKLESKVTAPEKPSIPRTLSQARDERGQFAPVWTGPTPLDAVLARKT